MLLLYVACSADFLQFNVGYSLIQSHVSAVLGDQRTWTVHKKIL